MSIIQNLFDVLRGKKIICFKRNNKYSKPSLNKIFYKYRIRKTIKKTKENLSKGKPIKVAVLIQYSSSCQFLPLFELMIKDEKFDPYIIITLDYARDIEFAKYRFRECFEFFIKKYPVNRILTGFDPQTNTHLDLIKDFDLVLDSNPYDQMAHPFYKIKNISLRGIPVLMSNYCYCGKLSYERNIYKMESEKYIWRHYADNSFNKKYMESFGINSNRIIVSGYSKMDPLYPLLKKTIHKTRKKIIIAPHHSIYPSDVIFLGCFFSYADLLLELPKMFPDIDFVFRPHPLLKYTLSKIWRKEKIENYYATLASFSNVEYQQGGDYSKTFAESDALIHDCGSFLAEYLYTDKPQCYLFSSINDMNEKKESQFLDFGKEMLDHVYKACSNNEILKFINNVQNEVDPMKEKRIEFANKVKINFPNATNIILKDIKDLYI